MRRFLVVGCGGSGGVTLQFLMDQLRADLQKHQVDRLPRGWQFIHIDVPTKADGTGPGLPPVVQAQGGRYLPIAYPGATYPAISEGVDNKLTDKSQLGRLVTWRPDPRKVTKPISDGAGQYRAVGRMLLLSKAKDTWESLNNCWAELQGINARQELTAVAENLSRGTAHQVGAEPVVLVVSSMAGGAGASMALDVCRLLTAVPGVSPGLIALFLYTPDVFGKLDSHLRSGVEPNAGAMMGELVASQLGAGRDDDIAMQRALGIDGEAVAGAPFGRVFPVGASIGGQGETFGTGSQVDIYRGLGRGLAALMSSGSATSPFVAFDLGNGNRVNTDRNSFGWGADEDSLVWGAFGYASLGLGRDRYAEYAAQRIARQAVDRLVAGHLQQGHPDSGERQLNALIEQTWPRFRDSLRLPAGAGPEDIRIWLQGELPEPHMTEGITRLIDTTVGDRLRLGSQVDVQQWLTAYLAQASRDRATLERGIRGLAYDWVYWWHRSLLEQLEARTSDVIATTGLPATRAMLDRLRDESSRWIDEMKRANRPADIADPGINRDRRWLGPRGLIGAGHELLSALRRGHERMLRNALQVECIHLMADVLASLRTELLPPLGVACGEALTSLENAQAAMVRDTGQARIATDEYGAWPTGAGNVPPRFSVAQNEVLITPVADFERDFVAHLRASLDNVEFAGAMQGAVSAVLHGRWPTTGSERADFPNLVREALWHPAALPEDPNQPGVTALARRGAYSLPLRPADVLNRARAYLARPAQPFSVFVNQSLNDYLKNPASSPEEKERRARHVYDAFFQALSLARPLVGVNGQTVARVHDTSGVRYAYKFSDLPFAGLSLQEQITADLEGDQNMVSTVVTNFAEANVNGVHSKATRLDVFGSYQNYSPVVFTSLLAPVAKRWTSSNNSLARGNFWVWRRARRLPGFLPTTDAARQGMIGGWFVGRLTGLIRFPGEHHGKSVEVYDPQYTEWAPFPEPLLTEPRLSLDLLPTVLESMILAVAACHTSPTLSPLRPYRLLREIYDKTRNEPGAEADVGPAADPAVIFHGGGSQQLNAARLLAGWIMRAETPSGVLPAAAQAGAPTDSPSERRARITQTLKSYREWVGTEFLPPGYLGAPGGGRYSLLDTTQQLPNIPMLHEIAPDMYQVLASILDLVANLPAIPPSERDSTPTLSGGF